MTLKEKFESAIRSANHNADICDVLVKIAKEFAVEVVEFDSVNNHENSNYSGEEVVNQYFDSLNKEQVDLEAEEIEEADTSQEPKLTKAQAKAAEADKSAE